MNREIEVSTKVSIFSDKETMKICDLVYEELRGVFDVSTKINITNIFLIAMRDYETFADLLYGDRDINYHAKITNEFFKNKGETENLVNFNNVSSNDLICFDNLKKACIKKYDTDRFFKSLFEKDEMALATADICRLAYSLSYSYLLSKDSD